MKTVDDHLVPWLASQTDMLALDWVDAGPVKVKSTAAPPAQDPNIYPSEIVKS